MLCRIYGRLLALHAGGDLPAAVGRRVERHVAACRVCARELGALRLARARLLEAGRRHGAGAAGAAAGEPDPLGETFWHAIRRELRSEGLCGPAAAARAPSRSGAGAGLAHAGRAVALAAAVLLAAVLFLPREAGERNGNGGGSGGGARDLTAAHGREGARDLEREAMPLGRPAGAGAIPVVPAALGAIEESQPIVLPGVEFHIERWGAEEGAAEELSF